MERVRLAAQVLDQVAAARAAIAASYWRLWRPERQSLPDAAEHGAEPPRKPNVSKPGQGPRGPGDDR